MTFKLTQVGKAVFVIAVTAVVIAAWRFLALDPSRADAAANGHDATRNVTAVPVPALPSSNSSRSGNTSVTAPTAGSAPRFAELRRKMHELRDPAEFVEYALQAPEDGGVALARAVAVECSVFAPTADRTQAKAELASSIVNAHESNMSQRLQALEQLPAERCRGVSSDPALLAKVDARVLADGQRDPLHRTTEALNASLKAAPEEQSKRLREVLALQDPYALDHARLFAQDLNGSDLSGGRAYLDGKQYQGDDMTVWHAAWSLVRCDFGERCDQEDSSLAYECAYESRCARSRDELVAMQFEKNPQRLGEVQALRQRLNEIVRTRQAEALLPPPGQDNTEELRQALSRSTQQQ